MAKVVVMTDRFKRRQTYEEVVEYIENDPDKIKYPNRAAKLLRNTFELSQLDGVGQALLEQQEVDAIKHKIKDYELQQLADRNETDRRTEKAIQTGKDEPQIMEGGSSSSGSGGGGGGTVKKVVGSVVSGGFGIARGLAGGVYGVASNVVTGFTQSGDVFHTPGATTPHRPATPVKSDYEAVMAAFHNDKLSEVSSSESERSHKLALTKQNLKAHLDEVSKQFNTHIPTGSRSHTSGSPSLPAGSRSHTSRASSPKVEVKSESVSGTSSVRSGMARPVGPPSSSSSRRSKKSVKVKSESGSSNNNAPSGMASPVRPSNFYIGSPQ